MKCDELTPIDLECNMGKDVNGVEHSVPWKAYDIDEVNAAIAELKAENRKLKRALYRACANWAKAEMEYEQFDSNVFMCGFATDKEISWKSMMDKCRAKADKFKEKEA